MKKILLFSLFLLSFCLAANAQNSKIKGLLTDQNGKPIGQTMIYVNGIMRQTTEAGVFNIEWPGDQEPEKIKIKKQGLSVLKWDFSAQKKSLHVFATNEFRILRGTVSERNGRPASGATIALAGSENLAKSRAAADGKFVLQLPRDTPLNARTELSVDGIKTQITDREFMDDFSYVILKRPSPELSEMVNRAMAIDENGKALSDIKLIINGKEVKTDAVGVLRTETAFGKTALIESEKYRLLRTDFDSKNNRATLVFTLGGRAEKKTGEATKPAEEQPVVTADFTGLDKDFNAVNKELESEKKFMEKSRENMMLKMSEITERIISEGSTNPGKRDYLLGKFSVLEDLLYQADQDFKAHQDRSLETLNRMKSVLSEKDSLLQLAENQSKIIEEEKRIIQEESRRDIIFISVIAGLALLLVIVLILVGRKMKNQHQKTTAQARDLATAYSEIKAAHTQVEIQKSVVEKRNAAITASINYAQRIQKSMLPTSENMQEAFRDYFVLFRPRDIVSGDFYWLNVSENNRGEKNIVIALADCTGHGVPGAFMSMLGDALLNQTVKVQGIMSPDEILEKMDQGVRNTLRQAETANRDGMDISICSIVPEQRTIAFAGAKSPLYVVDEEGAELYKGCKVSVGGQGEEALSFNKISFTLSEKNQACYLFSDGFQDQFGGEENKKFGPKRLRECLTENAALPFEKQKRILENKLDKWQGDRRQIDDILLIGFRI